MISPNSKLVYVCSAPRMIHTLVPESRTPSSCLGRFSLAIIFFELSNMTYTLPSLALVAATSAAETVMLRRQFENYIVPSQMHQLSFFVLFLNLALWVLYRSIVYPTFLSSFRHLPTAKVSFRNQLTSPGMVDVRQLTSITEATSNHRLWTRTIFKHTWKTSQCHDKNHSE